jgi:phosphate transport system protein
MPRETLDKNILNIKEEIIMLSSMVEQAMHNSIGLFRTRNATAARRILIEDADINGKRYAIENAILILIATQQPMAHDLRLLAAILEIATELERMGDYAKGIAKLVIRLGDSDYPVPTSDLEKMNELGIGMLHNAITAFMKEDYKKAAILPQEDDKVDALYGKVYQDTIDKIQANPSSVCQAQLMFAAAHNLERFADRVSNICERTVFIATGEFMEMESEEADEYFQNEDED